MNEFERRELELQRKENAWYDTLNPFMKLIDNNYTFFAVLATVNLLAFGLGLLIALIL